MPYQFCFILADKLSTKYVTYAAYISFAACVVFVLYNSSKSLLLSKANILVRIAEIVIDAPAPLSTVLFLQPLAVLV
jgi:hypothetical protein